MRFSSVTRLAGVYQRLRRCLMATWVRSQYAREPGEQADPQALPLIVDSALVKLSKLQQASTSSCREAGTDREFRAGHCAVKRRAI